MSQDRPKDHLIVPIFIPNEGCPYRCIYCHQETITSQSSTGIDASMITGLLEKAIHSHRFSDEQKKQVAFYGGTFTGLPEARMLELLEAVQDYVQPGLFDSIRVSTRPDEIDEHRLTILQKHQVKTIELGAQSLNDRVLSLSRRGYQKEVISKAFHTLKRQGFQVGLQLMPGLPGDSPAIFRQTIDETIGLKPDMVRLYPTLVIRGTALEKLYEQNRYSPLALSQAIELCQEACLRLEGAGIPVIRLGLMTSKTMIGQIVAGPWHEAFGFLVRSELYHRRIARQLPGKNEFSHLILIVPPSDFNLIKGYRNSGIKNLEQKTGARVVKIKQDSSIPEGEIRVESWWRGSRLKA